MSATHSFDDNGDFFLSFGDQVVVISKTMSLGTPVIVSITSSDGRRVRIKAFVGQEFTYRGKPGHFTLRSEVGGAYIEVNKQVVAAKEEHAPPQQQNEFLLTSPSDTMGNIEGVRQAQMFREMSLEDILATKQPEPSDLEIFAESIIQRISQQPQPHKDTWACWLANQLIDFTPIIGDAVGIIEALDGLKQAIAVGDPVVIAIACVGILLALIAIIPGAGDAAVKTAKKIINWFIDKIAKKVGRQIGKVIRITGRTPAARAQSLRRQLGYDNNANGLAGDAARGGAKDFLEKQLAKLKAEIFSGEGLAPFQKELAEKAKELNVKFEVGNSSVAVPDKNVIAVDGSLLKDGYNWKEARRQALHELSHVVYHKKYQDSENIMDIFLMELDANLWDGKSLTGAIHHVTRHYGVPSQMLNPDRLIDPSHIERVLKEYVQGNYRNDFIQLAKNVSRW